MAVLPNPSGGAHQPATGGDEYELRDVEDERVRGWRLEQFLVAGCTIEDAERLSAGRADYHDLTRLVASGCSLPLAVRLVEP